MPGTALNGAVQLASESLANEQSGGRVVILLTDGRNSSKTTQTEAVAAARLADVSVYPVAIEGPQFSPAALRALAAATGGTYHGATSSAGLQPSTARSLPSSGARGGSSTRPPRSPARACVCSQRSRARARTALGRYEWLERRRPTGTRLAPAPVRQLRPARHRPRGRRADLPRRPAAHEGARGRLARGKAPGARRPARRREERCRRRAPALAAGGVPRHRERVRPPLELETARPHARARRPPAPDGRVRLYLPGGPASGPGSWSRSTGASCC